MNKPYIRLAATFATALALVSCQKGDLLNVVQDDIELNENTAQYQEFIKQTAEKVSVSSTSTTLRPSKMVLPISSLVVIRSS